MPEYYIFDIKDDQNTPQHHSTTIVFCPGPAIHETSLRAALKRHYDNADEPDSVVLMGTDAIQPQLSRLAISQDVRSALPRHTALNAPPELHILSGGRTLECLITGPPNSYLQDPAFPRRVREQGILRLFNERGALLNAGPGFHYQKQSGAHCTTFVRTANILARSPEIAFIAFWLVPFINDETNFLYTDTSAIHALAYATAHLKQQVQPAYAMPVIDSFGSYDGVDQFAFQPNAFVLISASTSNGLEKKIINEKSVSPGRIATILYAGASANDGNILCNLPALGIVAIKNSSPDQCDECGRHVPLIRITGDHFLPENPTVRAEGLVATDSTRELRRFMADIAEKHILAVDHPPLRPDELRRELYIDLEHAINAPEETPHFRDQINRAVHKLPATLTRIVFQDDRGSELLARQVANKVTHHLSGQLTVTNVSDIFHNHHAHIVDSGTTLVVAGAVCSGKHLLAISKLMRHVQANHSVEYLIAMAKTRDKDTLAGIKSNIQYGEVAGEHDLQLLNSIFLPQDSAARKNAWELEAMILRDWKTAFSDRPEHQEVIDQRVRSMEAERSTGGLQTTLFWRRGNHDAPLRLTPGFTWWDHIYSPDRVSEADVYFTVAAVLHSAREGLVSRRPWAQQLYERVLLKPEAFWRFNDGVIQASLLRAAHLPELDYSVDRHLSETMADGIEALARNYQQPQGEAVPEFLFALASGRLRLQQHDTRALLGKLERNPDAQIRLFVDATNLPHPLPPK